MPEQEDLDLIIGELETDIPDGAVDPSTCIRVYCTPGQA